MTCRHFLNAKESHGTLDDPGAFKLVPSCALKLRNQQDMIRMNSAHADQRGGSILSIGSECPFADSDEWTECGWHEA